MMRLQRCWSFHAFRCYFRNALKRCKEKRKTPSLNGEIELAMASLASIKPWRGLMHRGEAEGCARPYTSCAQMLTTEDPLSQIALACGLADQAHLSKLFRRAVGETPSAWRRRNLTDAQAETRSRRSIGSQFVSPASGSGCIGPPP